MSYVKIYEYKKQISLDNGVTWQDVTPAEYAPSGEPIGYYDTYEECMALHRTIQSGYTCVGVDKHNQDVYEVSYDNGVTWSVVSTSAGTLIETNSYDCGYRTRTTSGTAYCTGYDKYVDVYSQVSTDYGSTWTTTATTPTLIEADSPDCGYVPPTPASPKYVLTLQDSSTVSAECDASSAITYNEVSAQYSNTLVTAEIGDCVSSIGRGAFYYCISLTSVTIPDSVTNIGQTAFEDCSGLTSVTIPDSVTTIGYEAFTSCVGLTSVTIEDGVETIGEYAFRYCTSLTSITIPNSVTSIDNMAFDGCSGLTSITVNATTPPTLGSFAFDNTNNCPIYVPCDSLSAYQAAWSAYASRIQCNEPVFSGKYKLTLSDSSIASAACDSSSAVTSGEVSTQYSGTVVSAVIGDCVTNINDNAFRKCSGLTDITISDSVTNIGNSTFMGCKKLSGLTIGNSVATIGYDAFNTCLSLSSITIPNSVLSIDYRAFNECSSLTSVTIPASVVNIGASAFVYCRGLTSVTVLATTPPTIDYNVFMDTNDCPIYVPSGSVNAYKTANKWSTYASRIQAIP